LRGSQRRGGGADQLVARRAINREPRQSRRDAAGPAADRLRANRIHDPLGDGRPRGARRDEQELVAAPACHRVDESNRLADDRRDLAQRVIARGLAMGIIEAREIVDVEDRHGDLELLPGCARELQLKDSLERPAVGQTSQRIAVGDALRPVDALGGVRGEPRPVDHDGNEIRKRRDTLAGIGIGGGVGFEGQRPDRLLNAVAAHHDRPRELHPALALGLAGALDALLRGEADGVLRLLHRVLEGRKVIGRIAARAGKREIARVGIPEERRGAIRAGRPQADLEELVKGRVGVTAAGYRPDRREEKGIWSQGLPSVAQPKDPSIEHSITPARASEARIGGHILRRVKLVLAIIHNEDAGALVDGLLEKEYRATRLHSSGGFLKQSNATIVLGVEDDKVEDVMAIIAEHCTSRTQVVNPMPPIMEPGEFFMPYPLEVEVGGATVFVVPVDRFERL
jgi:uncharacterized protein YaaQ